MVIDALTEPELNAITEYRRRYSCPDGEYCSDIPGMMPSSELLRVWSAEKEFLYHLLGDQLIVKKEMSFKKDSDELYKDFCLLKSGDLDKGRIHRNSDIFIKEYQKFCQRNPALHPDITVWYYKEDEITNLVGRFYIQTDDKQTAAINAVRWALEDLISCITLSENVYSGKDFSLLSSLDDPHPLVIKKGSKPARALGKIAKKFNLKGFEEFRIAHSQILNQKSVTGTVVLSIHPLDYMTMSDNNSDWESCMSWQEDGCYSQGTIEMMNSPSVIVAYLESKDPFFMFGGHIGDNITYEWSNKRWRQLFVVDPRILLGIKQYPYFNDDLSKETLLWIKELAEKNLGLKYEDQIYNTSEGNVFYPKTADEAISKTGVEVSLRTRYMYNDFGTADHLLIFKEGLSPNDSSEFFGTYKFEVVGTESVLLSSRSGFYTLCPPYSGPCQCMICGEIDHEFPNEGRRVCSICYDGMCCDQCGEYFHDDPYYIDDECLCPYCAEQAVVTCNYSGESHLQNNCCFVAVLPRLTAEQSQTLFEKKYLPLLCNDLLQYYPNNPRYECPTPRDKDLKKFISDYFQISDYLESGNTIELNFLKGCRNGEIGLYIYEDYWTEWQKKYLKDGSSAKEYYFGSWNDCCYFVYFDELTEEGREAFLETFTWPALPSNEEWHCSNQEEFFETLKKLDVKLGFMSNVHFNVIYAEDEERREKFPFFSVPTTGSLTYLI